MQVDYNTRTSINNDCKASDHTKIHICLLQQQSMRLHPFTVTAIILLMVED